MNYNQTLDSQSQLDVLPNLTSRQKPKNSPHSLDIKWPTFRANCKFCTLHMHTHANWHWKLQSPARWESGQTPSYHHGDGPFIVGGELMHFWHVCSGSFILPMRRNINFIELKMQNLINVMRKSLTKQTVPALLSESRIKSPSQTP